MYGLPEPNPQAITSGANEAIVIAGQTTQIQQHLRILVDRLQTAPNPETIQHLHQTFEQWRNIVLNGGEGLGTF